MAIPQSIRKHTLVIMLVAASSTAVAETPPPIVSKGSGAALACVTCHGVDGAGNAQAGYPALAQLPQAYLTKQIADFKSGTRSHPLMTPIAKAMSANDAESAARYYAGLAPPKIPATTKARHCLRRGSLQKQLRVMSRRQWRGHASQR